MANSHDPVTVRTKPLKNGTKSIYLDIYTGGRRAYEFLKLYLVPEVSRSDREKNREAMRLANIVKAQRIVEINEGRFGLSLRKGAKVYLRDFLDEFMTRYEGRTLYTWKSLSAHLQRFLRDSDIRLDLFNARYLERFIDYLGDERNLAQNSVITMLSKLKCLLSAAVRAGHIKRSPFDDMPPLRHEEKEREFLTLDELRRLADAPCPHPLVKRAFLFGCLTGLRISDIRALKWGDLRDDSQIVFRQKKTGGCEYTAISPQARELMGERKGDDVNVFRGLPLSDHTTRWLSPWMRAAGIERHITFHCSRHTFAVLMLDLGTDIYTVSKLLGHRSLATTQIYAHVLDKNKQAAVMRIPQIISNSDK